MILYLINLKFSYIISIDKNKRMADELIMTAKMKFPKITKENMRIYFGVGQNRLFRILPSSKTFLNLLVSTLHLPFNI